MPFFWTLVFEMSYPILRTGSCSEDWLCCSSWLISRSWRQWFFFLILDESKQPDSRLAIFRSLIWEPQVVAKWQPQGVLINNFFVIKWDFISARLTQAMTFMTVCVTVDRGLHLRSRKLRRFQALLKWTCWENLKYFQKGVNGPCGYPHAHFPAGDVINEWCLGEHGSHFRNQPSTEVTCQCVNDGFSVYPPIKVHPRRIRKLRTK